MQLVVVQRLLGQQGSVGGVRQALQDRTHRTTGREGVLKWCCPADGAGVDAVEVLKVGSDVGQPVGDLLDGGDAGYAGQRGVEGAGAVRCDGDGDVGSDGEGGVDAGLPVVGGGEHGRGDGHGHGDGQAGGAAGHQAAATADGLASQIRHAAGFVGGWLADTPVQKQGGQPPDQQCHAGPGQRRGKQGGVVHRGHRYPLWDDHHLVATSRGQPEHDTRAGQKQHVEPHPQGQGGPRPDRLRRTLLDRGRVGAQQSGHWCKLGDDRQQHPGQGTHGQPGRGQPRSGAQGERVGEHCTAGPDRCAEQPIEQRGNAEQNCGPPWCRAAQP